MKDGIFLIFHFREFLNCSIFEVLNFFGKTQFFRIRKKFCKKSLEISLDQKTLLLRQKQGFGGQKQGFPHIPNLWNIQNLFYSEFSKNYEKMMSKSNFYFCKKLVPTQILTRIFEFEFGMQGPTIYVSHHHKRPWNTTWLNFFLVLSAFIYQISFFSSSSLDDPMYVELDSPISVWGICSNLRHKCTLAVPKFIQPNFGNFLKKSSGIKCKK